MNHEIKCPSDDPRCEEGYTLKDEKIGALQWEIKERKEEFDKMTRRHDEEQSSFWEEVELLEEQLKQLEL